MADDDNGNILSKKADLVITLIQKLGYPTVVTIAMTTAAVILYNDMVKPIAANHIKTLDTLGESSKSTAESFKVLATAHADLVETATAQKDLLEGMDKTQREIKQVLKEGLKIQKEDRPVPNTPNEPPPPGI